MSDIMGERSRLTNQLDLSPEDKVLQQKIDKITIDSVRWLSITLIFAVILEGYTSPRSQHHYSKINNTFIGTPTGEARSALVSIPDQLNTPSVFPKQETLSSEPVAFSIGQRVITSRGEVQKIGVVSEIVSLSGDMVVPVSYLIVKFEDGTSDGFDPHELTPLSEDVNSP